ncbi:MAG: hypothetical protein E7494_14410 [Ruminococcus albus]|nr:hypothetical protein [Ruminococcus albus]
MTNNNMISARKKQYDEYFTLLDDVERIVEQNRSVMLGKTIICNCNDGENSAFWLYLSANFTALGLKRLIAVSYGDNAHVLEMSRVNGTPAVQKTLLSGDGDFRSIECLNYLQQADIVVTNPPFSLFREYILLMMKMKKQMLVLGNLNAVNTIGIFPFIYENKLRLTGSFVRNFLTADAKKISISCGTWFTNLPEENYQGSLLLKESYCAEKYPCFDNYDAINVDRTVEIPFDYYGIMGVPISYLLHHDSEHFKIMGITGTQNRVSPIKPCKTYIGTLEHSPDGTVKNSKGLNNLTVIALQDKPEGLYFTAENANGYLIRKYARLLIKRVTA